jgi:DNA-directed RNA polymerase specialized sigma24 family protein
MTEATAPAPAAAVTRRAAEDREAFADWIRPHWDGLAQLARRLAPPAEWEDVLQEALSAAWRKRGQFDEQRATGCWPSSPIRLARVVAGCAG